MVPSSYNQFIASNQFPEKSVRTIPAAFTEYRCPEQNSVFLRWDTARMGHNLSSENVCFTAVPRPCDDLAMWPEDFQASSTCTNPVVFLMGNICDLA
jgi:hypothetical protein